MWTKFDPAEHQQMPTSFDTVPTKHPPKRTGMAQRRLVQLVDDIDGTVLAQGDGETVRFTIDGTSYEVDLSKRNAAQLRRSLEPYRAAGRKTSGSTGRSRASSRDYDPRAVRKWAESNNVDIPARGRIPATVVERYRAAGN